MTVRTWFRIQRGELWRTDPQTAKCVDQVARLVVTYHTPWVGLSFIPVGPLSYIIFDMEEYNERQDVYHRLEHLFAYGRALQSVKDITE